MPIEKPQFIENSSTFGDQPAFIATPPKFAPDLHKSLTDGGVRAILGQDSCISDDQSPLTSILIPNETEYEKARKIVREFNRSI